MTSKKELLIHTSTCRGGSIWLSGEGGEEGNRKDLFKNYRKSGGGDSGERRRGQTNIKWGKSTEGEKAVKKCLKWSVRWEKEVMF